MLKMYRLVIFTIIVLGGLAFFFFGQSELSLASTERFALELARQRIEELKSVSYDEIVPTTENNIQVGNLSGTRTTTVTTITTGLKEITVAVSWYEKARNNQISLTTLIAENE
jgi:hypothetical protein